MKVRQPTACLAGPSPDYLPDHATRNEHYLSSSDVLPQHVPGPTPQPVGYHHSTKLLVTTHSRNVTRTFFTSAGCVPHPRHPHAPTREARSYAADRRRESRESRSLGSFGYDTDGLIARRVCGSRCPVDAGAVTARDREKGTNPGLSSRFGESACRMAEGSR